jgi:plastocyanin domain-containing protein
MDCWQAFDDAGSGELVVARSRVARIGFETWLFTCSSPESDTQEGECPYVDVSIDVSELDTSP